MLLQCGPSCPNATVKVSALKEALTVLQSMVPVQNGVWRSPVDIVQCNQ